MVLELGPGDVTELVGCGGVGHEGDELVDMAESVVDQVDELTLTSPAGAPQLGWRGDPVKIAEALMASYYDHAEPLPPLVGHQARQVNADPLVALQLGADARKTMVS